MSTEKRVTSYDLKQLTASETVIINARRYGLPLILIFSLSNQVLSLSTVNKKGEKPKIELIDSNKLLLVKGLYLFIRNDRIFSREGLPSIKGMRYFGKIRDIRIFPA